MTVRRTFAAWRERARALLKAGVPPERADWQQWSGAGSLLEDVAAHATPDSATFRVPPALVERLEIVACHRDFDRYALMYRMVWRVTHGEPALLQDAADDDVIRMARMAKAVQRSSHKMTAFVRFREVVTDGATVYVAVFEPEHDVLERTAPFFVKRFGTMVWTIITPDGGAHWDRKALTFFDVDDTQPLPAADATEALWLTYYSNIFNPARLNVAMMKKEMPVAYWKQLPEAQRIPQLVAEAPLRAGKMVATTLTRQVAPYPQANTAVARDASAGMPGKHDLDTCRRCPLGERATQGVPGRGPAHARVMLVGEQPGDEEDLAGKPFVGPAGRLLRRAMDEAGMDASQVYITNAVKHFSYELRGKRRIHKTPAQREIEACEHWLEAEIAQLKPQVIVALGASALSGVLHRRVKVGEARAAALTHASGARVLASYHPSAVLRAPDEARKDELYGALIADLRTAVERSKR